MTLTHANLTGKLSQRVWLKRVTIRHSQPSIGISGFILHTQKYNPPIVGLSCGTLRTDGRDK